MANETPEQIVDKTELARTESRPCPYCLLYDGTHLVTCEYLKHKGNVDAKRLGKPNKTIKVEEANVEESTKEVEREDSEEKNETESSTKKLLDSMKPKK